MKKLKNILLTGFEPFGKYSYNVSHDAIQGLHNTEISGHKIYCAQLPVLWDKAFPALKALIVKLKPAIIICFGMSESNKIRLEKFASNWQDVSLRDNNGSLADNEIIQKKGDDVYWSRLPLDKIRKALQKKLIPVEISNDAGGYLCNNIYYQMMYYRSLSKKNFIAGFVHLPALEADKGLPIEISKKAVEIIVSAVTQ
ncbi:MAG: pyroglutamyl-peptidase I [Planctomycetes bacterium]|nr:pyroglutamyl-peptidase I [Planctomycetota bacterium]